MQDVMTDIGDTRPSYLMREEFARADRCFKNSNMSETEWLGRLNAGDFLVYSGNGDRLAVCRFD